MSGLMSLFGGGIRYNAEEHLNRSFDVHTTPRIVASTFNGTIQIVAGSNERVEASVSKKSSAATQEEADANLAKIEVVLLQEGDTVTLTARKTERMLNNVGVEVSLVVPAGSRIEAQTSNGAVTISNITGSVKAQTSNGAITVQAGAGELVLQTSNGKIDITASDAIVDARTANGAIDFRGSLAGRRQNFHTSNGAIVLRLPATASFKLEAGTSNGKVRSEFSLKQSSSNRRDSELHGVAGENPETTLTLNTSNGGIQILKEEAGS